MNTPCTPGEIAVLNCGSQTAHLLVTTLKLRACACARLYPADTAAEELRHCSGIIISGSPASVYDASSPQPDPDILKLNIPILGLCYGLHWLAQTCGGKVEQGKLGEFGPARIHITHFDEIFQRKHTNSTVWMSHGDHVKHMPRHFIIAARSTDCQFAAITHATKPWYGWQFHPEVQHTQYGTAMLSHFAALCKPTEYTMADYYQYLIQQIQQQAGNRSVFMLVSGGIDSTVTFFLLTKALGADRVKGLLIDNGLMRQDEIAEIQQQFDTLGMTNIIIHGAAHEFFNSLSGLHDAQAKRAAIGQAFVEIYQQITRRKNCTPDNGWMLGQGTLYPDFIESGGADQSAQIKLHHNMRIS